MIYFTRLSLFFIALFLISSISADALTASFTVDHTSGCPGLTVKFTNTSSGATSYNWNFGNSDSSTIKNPSTTYASVGTYTVKLTVSDGTSTSTATQVITIYDNPLVAFKVDDSGICLGSTINFTDLSTFNSPGSATFKWNFGDGNSSASENPAYTYGSTGTWNVTLSVTNSAGCKSGLTKSAYITVYGKPTANFLSSTTVLCDTPATFTFTNKSTGTPIPLKYKWDFGDGGTDSGASPSHTYHKLGMFTVRLITTTGVGCSDTITQTNYITVTKIYPSFTTVATACVGTYVVFTNTSTPTPTDTKWDFGDGSAIVDGSPTSHSFSASGTYHVKMYTYNGTSCVDSTSQSIVINPLPKVNFSYTPTQPCPAPATETFTNTTTGATSYKWDFGDGVMDTAKNPKHTYYANGSYQVKLYATSANGCTDSSIGTYVNIYPLKVDIYGNGHTPEIGNCIPFPVSFSYVPYYDTPLSITPTKYPYSISSVSWDFGDGSPLSSASSPSHTYTTLGTFKVKVTITTANGCTATDSFTVLTGPKPTAKFTAKPDTVCVGQPVFFKNLSVNAKTFQWFFGDGNSNLDDTPNYSYGLPGIDSVTLIANNNGCRDTFTSPIPIDVRGPVANFNFSYGCTPYGKVNFAMKIPPVDTNEITSLIWDFNDGTKDTVHKGSVIHTFTSVGTYYVTLITYNDTNKCHDTLSKTVTITNPTPSFTASDTVVCRNQKVTFSSVLTGGTPLGPSKYEWIFDTTTIFLDTASSIVYKFSTSGYHTVSVVIPDNRGCYDTSTRIHYITIPLPKANFGASPLTGCAPLAVNFTDSSKDLAPAFIKSYAWNFGDGPWAPGTSSPTHVYSGGGSYPVTLAIVDNIGCVDTISKPGFIQVNQPKASFAAAPTTVCLGSPVIFNNTSTTPPLTAYWDFGSGASSTTFSPTYVYPAVGTYQVTLAIKDNLGCKDTLVKPAYINVVATPVASFTMSDSFTVCPVLTVDFTNTSSSGSTSFWDFGDGNTSLVTNPENIYVKPGVFLVTLIATNRFGCSDTARDTVKLAGYKGVLKYSPLTGCAPLTVYFTANVTGVPHFVYDFSDGSTTTSSLDTASHTYYTPGPYVPRIVMSDDSGCRAISYGIDTIKVDGVLSGFTYLPFPACDSGNFELLDTSHGTFSTVTSRLWELPDGTTSTNNIVFQHYHHPGSYPITLITNTSSGCKDTLHTAFVVHPSPKISAGLDTTICKGDAAILMPSGGAKYIWSPKATLSCDTCTNPQAFPVDSTSYMVIGIDTNGCRGIDTVLVGVKTKTTSVASDSAQICQGNSVRLKDSAGAYTVYNWIPPTGLDDPSSPDPVASPNVTTTYMAIAKQGSCDADTQLITVIVHPKPDISLGPNQTIVAGSSAQLQITGNNLSRYYWNPVATLSCDSCDAPLATPPKTTKYTVTVYSDYGCYDSANITVFVVCDQSQVFMPNTFTPNGDGVDDIFYPRGKGLQIIKSFRIYDRWGQLLYTAENINVNDITTGWNGTFKGTKLNADVFVYIVDAVCVTGEPISWKGNISLIR